MRRQLASTTFDALKRIWSDAGVIPMNAHWHGLDGGRTNPIWRVDMHDGTRLVCKLFMPNTATPLFANDGTREALALQALERSGIAPEIVAFQDTSFGESLIYRHVEGPTWNGDVQSVARLMARLHQQPLPAGLPEVTLTSQTMIADGLAMLAQSGHDLGPPPDVAVGPTSRQAFLHGDIVPGNILASPGRLVLIDWQCPVIGDPCADLAMFLSPAMQVVYGRRQLTATEIESFLVTYQSHNQDMQTVARYRVLEPLFHWRMAAYCRWKTALGDLAYEGMADLELAELQQS
ncbi:phosphotransferase [Aliiroseovarius sp. 2305UL8-7]|uniref:phosphotransferase n=1 Tax=Aliiroseovarius conchicola TaxID=3121637 RepID=UPI003529B2CB